MRLIHTVNYKKMFEKCKISFYKIMIKVGINRPLKFNREIMVYKNYGKFTHSTEKKYIVKYEIFKFHVTKFCPKLE